MWRFARIQVMGIVGLALVVGALLSGCTGGPDSPADTMTIKIVSSLPRTGSAKAQTDTIVNGIRMALEDVDSKVGPFTIDYLDWDDATAAAGNWTAEAEAANAERAARHPDVMVYLGTYNSGAAKIAMPILNRAGLLMISPANTWPG
jgi:branched-chain amino acid transport system substrate-binding protein